SCAGVVVAAGAIARDRLVVVAGAIRRDRHLLADGLVRRHGLIVGLLNVARRAGLRAGLWTGGSRHGGGVVGRRASVAAPATGLEHIVPGGRCRTCRRGQRCQRTTPYQLPVGSHGTFSFALFGVVASVSPGAGPERTTNPLARIRRARLARRHYLSL